MKTTSLFLAAVLTSTIFVPRPSPPSSQARVIATMSPAAKDDALYTDGTRAINEGRWSDAVDLFNKVVQHARPASRRRSLLECLRRKQRRPARPRPRHLRRTPPRLPQERMARRVRRSRDRDPRQQRHPCQPQTEQDEDLKLLALNAIMQQDEARAIPASSNPRRQQLRQAQGTRPLRPLELFQAGPGPLGDRPRPIVSGAASQSDPHALHRRQTIRGSARRHLPARAMTQVRKAILQAYPVTGSPDKLVEAAPHESNPELARTAVQ